MTVGAAVQIGAEGYHLARIDWRMVHCAAPLHLVGNQAVASVEEQDPELLRSLP